MAISVEQSWANGVAKYASREVYGIIRTIPEETERLELMNRDIIISVLADPISLDELTLEEITNLTTILSIIS